MNLIRAVVALESSSKYVRGCRATPWQALDNIGEPDIYDNRFGLRESYLVIIIVSRMTEQTNSVIQQI